MGSLSYESDKSGGLPIAIRIPTDATWATVLGTIANGCQIVNRADVGGKYQGTWHTAQTAWVTIVRKLTSTYIPKLPQTGY